MVHGMCRLATPQQYAQAIMERPSFKDANGNFVPSNLANYNSLEFAEVEATYSGYGDIGTADITSVVRLPSVQ